MRVAVRTPCMAKAPLIHLEVDDEWTVPSSSRMREGIGVRVGAMRFAWRRMRKLGAVGPSVAVSVSVDGTGTETGTGTVQFPIKSTPPSPFPPIRVSVNPR